jgi:glycosyltransferase involved in cell wall biosynthesis
MTEKPAETGRDAVRDDVSVVICTRDRPAGVLMAVRSVLRDAPRADVVVIDQSQGDQTQFLLAGEPGLATVRVIHSPPRGLAAARNTGVSSCHGTMIAFTDDDCEVVPGWLAAMRAAFLPDERIGMVFGSVVAPEYDRGAGFVPAYQVPSFLVAHGLAQKTRIEGMGACMAVRRNAWEALSGFDEALGSGATFRAGEDSDFAMRALVGGWLVAETPEARVVHHGFRTWDQGHDLIAGYMYGLGATNMKMLRLGGWRAIRPLSTLAWRWLAGSPVVDLNHVPPRMPRLASFLRGAAHGMLHPVSPSGRFG